MSYKEKILPFIYFNKLDLGKRNFIFAISIKYLLDSLHFQCRKTQLIKVISNEQLRFL